MTDLSEQALTECQQLLASAKFDLRRGVCLWGTVTSVSLLIQPDLEDTACRRVQVMCQSAGHLRVDWDRVGIWMVDSGTGKEWFDVLDSRGRSRAFLVPYSDSGVFGFMNPTVVVDRVASFETIEAAAFNSRGGHIWDKFPLKATSPDGRLSATVEMQPVDTLHVMVEARDESLRGADVALEMRSKRTGEVLYRREFKLRFKDGLLGEWSVKDELLGIHDDVDLFLYPAQREPGK